MTLAPEHQADFAALPVALRDLLAAELAAGNTIVEVGHSHPAPPAGAYFLLARPVTTRERTAGGGLDYWLRNSPHHSGEFTDARRFHFILEPPLPPAPEPDMHAIRAALEARQRSADDMRRVLAGGSAGDQAKASTRAPAVPAPSDPSRLDRFRASMVLDFERWREGTSYDLALLAEATPDERAAIESLLLSRGVRDWRDVEALAALGTPKARALLRETLLHGEAEFATAVTRYAPELVEEEEKTRTLVRALEETDFYGGLTQALTQVETHHPPAVIDALLRGVLRRAGGAQVHFAAMLLYLHGRATSAFDWAQRPYFLQFNTPDRTTREVLFRDLCARIGIDPEPYVGRG